jgi:AraC-like DNA-binding protein
MKFIHIIVFLLISISAFSQKALTDKEYKELQSKARMHINGSLDSSFYYSNKIEESSNNLHKAFAKGIKSYLHQLNGDTIQSNLDFNNSLIDLNNSIPSIEKTRTTAFLFLYKGLTNWKRKKHSESLLNYEKAKQYSLSIDDNLQIINLNNNIALVLGEMGNYSSAIKVVKGSDLEIDKLKFNLSIDEFKIKKSNVYNNLGSLYNSIFYEKKVNKFSDSAIYYFNKSLLYSDNLIDNKLSAESNLANLYLKSGEINKAENLFHSIFKYARDNNYKNELLNASYNLGRLYYNKTEYEKALIYFKKVDSLHLKNNYDDNEFMYSKYYQSIIFDKQNNNSKAIENADLFISEFENKNFNKLLQKNKINLYLESKDVIKDIEIIKNRNKISKIIFYMTIIFVLVLIFILFYFIVKNKKEKQIANEKIKELVNEFKKKTDEPLKVKKYNTLSIDNQKELEIVEALEKLEDKKYYLSIDFNQQNVAKKIKTNTTYLSHVVNKNFNKSFREYSNELKINYAIEELINNPTYRKYSTQAIAESVGFKNANSFTKSFKKRAGVSPAQFISNLE